MLVLSIIFLFDSLTNLGDDVVPEVVKSTELISFIMESKKIYFLEKIRFHEKIISRINTQTGEIINQYEQDLASNDLKLSPNPEGLRYQKRFLK